MLRRSVFAATVWKLGLLYKVARSLWHNSLAGLSGHESIEGILLQLRLKAFRTTTHLHTFTSYLYTKFAYIYYVCRRPHLGLGFIFAKT